MVQNGWTSLKIYNLLGEEVMNVYEGNAAAHQVCSFNVNMDKFAGGVYFYSLEQGGNVATKKMILLK